MLPIPSCDCVSRGITVAIDRVRMCVPFVLVKPLLRCSYERKRQPSRDRGARKTKTYSPHCLPPNEDIARTFICDIRNTSPTTNYRS